MGDWTSVIGTLAGAVAGGGIAYLVSTRQMAHQRRLEVERRQLANFESIHRLLTKVAHQAGVMSTNVIGVLGYGAKLKTDGEVLPLDELRMLVDFYAPILKPDIELIAEHWMKLARAIGETIMTQERTEDWKAKTVLAATTASADILKCSDAAKKKLNDLATTYTSAS
jgi:hypothetical protein